MSTPGCSPRAALWLAPFELQLLYSCTWLYGYTSFYHFSSEQHSRGVHRDHLHPEIGAMLLCVGFTILFIVAILNRPDAVLETLPDKPVRAAGKSPHPRTLAMAKSAPSQSACLQLNRTEARTKRARLLRSLLIAWRTGIGRQTRARALLLPSAISLRDSQHCFPAAQFSYCRARRSRSEANTELLKAGVLKLRSLAFRCCLLCPLACPSISSAAAFRLRPVACEFRPWRRRLESNTERRARTSNMSGTAVQEKHCSFAAKSAVGGASCSSDRFVYGCGSARGPTAFRAGISMKLSMLPAP